MRYVYGIGQTADGLIWIGSRRGLHHFDGQAWERVYEPEVLTSRIDVVHSSDTGDLWLGHRSRGVFHRTPSGWDQTDAEHGLADNTVRAILKTRDQSVWAVSDRGTSRFDGQIWTTPALPPELRLGPRGSLRETSDGTLWINTASETWHRRAWPLARPDRTRPANFKTVRHRPDPNTPETTIAFAQAEVSQPGNTPFSGRARIPGAKRRTSIYSLPGNSTTNPGHPTPRKPIRSSKNSAAVGIALRSVRGTGILTLTSHPHRWCSRSRHRSGNKRGSSRLLFYFPLGSPCRPYVLFAETGPFTAAMRHCRRVTPSSPGRIVNSRRHATNSS